MNYRVLLDSHEIMDTTPPFLLINPTVELEISAAGSFEFTMPPDHPYIDQIKLMLSTVEVYENDELVFFGRPTEVHTDFFKQKKVYCEGALAYLNDTVQRPYEYESIPIHSFFGFALDNHNAQVAGDRKFFVGNVTVENKSVYRKLDYESTFDVIKTMCLDTDGGYLFTRRVNGVNYLDWLKEMPYDSNQPVEFGLNLLNLSTQTNTAEVITCLIPLGDEIQESEEGSGTSPYGEVGTPLTVAYVNGGSDVIVWEEGQAIFGPVVRVERFSGVDDPAALLQKGREYLEKNQFEGMVVECSAAELHGQNYHYEQFKIGQKIRCLSTPHSLDSTFPLMKMTLNLDTAVKQITLGTPPKQKLTEIVKPEKKQVACSQAAYDEIGSSTGYDDDSFYYIYADEEASG